MVTTRTLTEPDFGRVIALDGAAFGYDPTTADAQSLALPLLRSGRIIGTFDGPPDDERLVAAGAILDKQLTFPGSQVSPVAAVTWIAVLPGEQGHGLLRGLMTHQLHGLHDDSREPVAILTASESGLYGRFGYGMAIPKAELTMPHRLAFRPRVVTERVREVDRDEALPHLRRLHERLRPTRVGYLTRDDVTWDALFHEPESAPGGAGKLQFAVHPDGVLAFRIVSEWSSHGPKHRLAVVELCATTPVATASLWRHALDRALVREITYHRHGPDEPLRDLLVDPRAIDNVPRDHVWLRLVDLERAVPLRSYSAEVDVVVQLHDSFCPWNDGRWRLRLGVTDGSAERSTDTAAVDLDVADLAAAFLGGSRLSRLAAAGLVGGEPAAISALDAALATARAPYCPEGF